MWLLVFHYVQFLQNQENVNTGAEKRNMEVERITPKMIFEFFFFCIQWVIYKHAHTALCNVRFL